MVGVPFIYFTILSIFIFSKNGKHIDVAFLISLMFAFSALVGMYLVVFDMANEWCIFHGYETLEATIVYCGLITLCVIPFIRVSSSSIQLRPIRDSGALKGLALTSFIWILFMIVFNAGNLILALTTDMGALIKQGLMEDIDPTESLPFLLKIPAKACNYLFRCFWIFIFLAFYSRYVQRMPKSYMFMFLSTSLSGPVFGMLGGDRSKTVYWILALILCFFFFKREIGKKESRRLIIVMSVLIAAAVVYLIFQTDARFAEKARLATATGTASQNSILLYLGQPYINFCYFYEHQATNFHFYGILFPFLTSLAGGMVGGVTIQQYLTLVTGNFTGVFYTFIGQIMVAAGFGTALAFCLLFTIVALAMVKKKRSYNLLDGYVYMAFASVLFLGLFGHYYTNPYLTPPLFIFYFLLRSLSYENSKKV